MACVNGKGQLTESAKTLLISITENAKTPEEIAQEIKQPLFKIRSSLREMKSMGFVAEHDGAFIINERVKTLLG